MSHFNPVPALSRVSLNESPCSSCSKHIQNMIFYRSKYHKLLKKFGNLKKTIKINSRKIGRDLAKLVKLKSKVSLIEVIDKLPFVSVNGKTLAKTILRNPVKHLKWNENARILAQNIHYVSPVCYKFLKSHLNINLPNLSSIYRWMPYKNLNPGFNNHNR